VKALDTVLVDGTWRAIGVVSQAELEELERAHDGGDIRAESRLELLRKGRPGDLPPGGGEPLDLVLAGGEWRTPGSIYAWAAREMERALLGDFTSEGR
jgi:hypothetical protein